MLHLLRHAQLIASAVLLTTIVVSVGGVRVRATDAMGAAYAPRPTSGAQAAKPILLTDPVPDPKQEGVMWFAPTGHTLRGKFLDYWQHNGGLAQFGYPLTEEFFEEVGADNKLYQVQYFERNRFEYHPENAGTPYEVLLGTLGLDFRKADPPAPQQPNAYYSSETGHNLSGKFLDYWQSHGALAVNGYPITEAVQERSTNGKEYLVQWFERSRFELHPENAGSPYEVLLGVLGIQLSEKKGYPYGWYPRFGYAVDYSWVAGQLTLLYGCSVCECPYVYYKSPNGQIIPWGSGWTTVDIKPDHLVLFGHREVSTEQDPRCDPNHGNYKVDKVQQNPADTSALEMMKTLYKSCLACSTGLLVQYIGRFRTVWANYALVL